MKLNLVTTAIVFAIISIILAFGATRLVIPDPIPGSEDRLNASHIILTVGAVGPESLAFDPNGEGPYTGVADGRILKWQGQVNGWIDFAVTSSNRSACVRPFAPEMEHICGRPLGLRFDQKSGDLYISDAYLGLLVVGPSGGLATQLLTEVEGEPLHFTNDMDIDEEEDVIYFTDTSRAFRRSVNRYSHAQVVRDHKGELIEAMSRCYQGMISPEAAEAMGIREALSWVKQRQQHDVIIETDCLAMVQWIRSSHVTFSYVGRLVDECRQLLMELQDKNVMLRFIKRSANSVAHYLASYSSSLADRKWEKENVHPEFLSILCNDLK